MMRIDGCNWSLSHEYTYDSRMTLTLQHLEILFLTDLPLCDAPPHAHLQSVMSISCVPSFRCQMLQAQQTAAIRQRLLQDVNASSVLMADLTVVDFIQVPLPPSPPPSPSPLPPPFPDSPFLPPGEARTSHSYMHSYKAPPESFDKGTQCCSAGNQ